MSLFPGTYQVTIGMGWPGSVRNGDIEYVEINDVILRNFSCSTLPGSCSGVREFSATVTVKSHGPGGMLMMSFGSPFQNQYTILSYLKIVAVTKGAIVQQPGCARPVAPVCDTTGPFVNATTTVANQFVNTGSPRAASDGLIAGVTVGVILLVAAIAVVVILVLRRAGKLGGSAASSGPAYRAF